jgi:hypothetical protein
MLSLGFVGLLIGGLFMLTGCESGTPMAPEEIPASWDQLTFVSTAEEDTLLIAGDGSLSLSGTAAEDTPEFGLLAPATWCAVKEAADRAEMEPLPGGLGGLDLGAGVVRLRDYDGFRGFSWTSEDELSEAQHDLVILLRGIRDGALSPEDPRLDPVPIGALLHGYHAALSESRELIVRDEDALLRLIREALPGEAVIIPTVDFQNEMVLAIFVGTCAAPSDVEIWETARWTLDGDLQLAVTVSEPSPNCEPRGTVSPFQLARLPKTDGEVFFLWERVVTGCSEE